MMMKAMTKQQLADAAGVSVRTLMSWCEPFRTDLENMGLKPKSKLLSPKMVGFIAEKLCIDL